MCDVKCQTGEAGPRQEFWVRPETAAIRIAPGTTWTMPIKNAGAAILGVSPDPVASHARFKAKHKLELALASDEPKAMLEAYGVWAEKSMYGRKYMGVERTTFLIGKDGKIAAVWNKVSVPGHAEAVLAAVKAL